MPTSKRTTAPAFQFYPKDFLSSTRVQRMSLTEVGVYIVLLSHAWLSGGIPTDTNEIAKLVKMPAGRFRRMWAGPLSECFTKRGAVLINERLDAERKKQIAFRDRQSENGRKGGRRGSQALPNPLPTEKGSPSTRVMESANSKDVLQEKGERLDLAFEEFRDAYPKERRKGGYLVQQDYIAAAMDHGAARLLNALRNHIASEQWANPKHIPGMDTWLRDEHWRQEKPAAGAASSSAANPKTAGNVGAFQRFVERGRTA